MSRVRHFKVSTDLIIDAVTPEQAALIAYDDFESAREHQRFEVRDEDTGIIYLYSFMNGRKAQLSGIVFDGELYIPQQR